MARTFYLWLLVAGVAGLALLGGAAAVETVLYPDNVKRLAQAIATAERGAAELASGQVRNNNPGDLESGGALLVFATLEQGWNALYKQVSEMFDGSSSYYNPSMSISQVGWIYADGQDDPAGAQNWISNVSAFLGVNAETPIGEL